MTAIVTKSFNELDRRMFDFLDKHLLETKKRTYRAQIRIFRTYLEEKVLGLNIEGCRSYYHYLDDLVDKGLLEPRSFNIKVSTFKFAIKKIYEHSEFKDDIGARFSLNEVLSQFKLKTIGLKYIKPSTYPSKDEVSQIVSECEDETIQLAIKAIFNTGLRISELTNVRMKDIRLGKKKENWSYIRVLGKGDRYDEVPIKTETLNEIIDYFHSEKDYNELSFLFEHTIYGERVAYNPTSLSNRMFKISGYRAHQYRHSCLGNAYKETKDVKGTQTLARHSSSKTTIDEYVKSSFDEDDLDRIFKGF